MSRRRRQDENHNEKSLIVALSTEFQVGGWKPVSAAEIGNTKTISRRAVSPSPQPKPTDLELFKQKWQALHTGWKALAAEEIILGMAAIIIGTIFLSKVIMTVVVVSAATLIITTAVGHLVHIAKTPVLEQKKKKPLPRFVLDGPEKKPSVAPVLGKEEPALVSAFTF